MVADTPEDRAVALVAQYLPRLAEDPEMVLLAGASAACDGEVHAAQEAWDAVLSTLPEGSDLEQAQVRAWGYHVNRRMVVQARELLKTAQAAVERVSKLSPEGVALAAAKARAEAAFERGERRRVALAQELAPAIVDAYQRETDKAGLEFLLSLADAVPDPSSAAWLCAGLLGIARESHDMLRVVPLFRRLVTRAVSPEHPHRLSTVACSALNTFGCMLIPDDYPFSPSGAKGIETDHHRWRSVQVGCRARPVMRTVRPVTKDDGVTTLERTLVIRLDDGSLIGAPQEAGERFLERTNVDLLRTVRSLG